MFRFYTNMAAAASRRIAFGLFMLALMLAGIGLVIVAYPKVFAYLLAAVVFFAAVSVAGIAVKIFITSSRIKKANWPEQPGPTIHELNDFNS